MNVCYIGVDNPLSVAAFGCSGKTLVLHTDNGTLVRTEAGYLYSPAVPGTARISAYCVRGRDSVRLGEAVFRVKELPTPRAAVSGMQQNSIRKAALLQQTGILAQMDCFDFDFRFVVESYEFRVERTNGSSSKPIPIAGPYFTQEVKELVGSLRPGDRVYFEKIIAIRPSCAVRSLGTLALLIA